MQKLLGIGVLAAFALAGCGVGPMAPDTVAVEHEPLQGEVIPRVPTGPERDVTIIAEGYRFVPAVIRAAPGERLRITLVNKGDHEHSWVLGMPNETVPLGVYVRPGESLGGVVTAPNVPGVYFFHCPVGDHNTHGMVGRLIVEPRPAR